MVPMSMIISHKYEVIEQLGQGGMGVVYKVRHSALDTSFALKILPHHLMENADMVARFYREARVMARLRHANIAQVLDIDRDEELNCHYFVMEYIQGKTLQQYIQEKGPLPLSEVLEISRQAARALAYAHSQTPPIIHRDIKPANIMIEDSSGRVVVMDFGIAKETTRPEVTKSGTIIGTMQYCSPEQMRHEPLDGGADIYGLGMVMCEAYTGRSFFAGLDETAIIDKVLHDPQEHVAYFTRPTPAAFTTFVTKAIAKSRGRRYRRVEDLLRDLDTCLAPLKTVSPPVVAPVLAGNRELHGQEKLDKGKSIKAPPRWLQKERQPQATTFAQAQGSGAQNPASTPRTSVLWQQQVKREESNHSLLPEQAPERFRETSVDGFKPLVQPKETTVRPILVRERVEKILRQEQGVIRGESTTVTAPLTREVHLPLPMGDEEGSVREKPWKIDGKEEERDILVPDFLSPVQTPRRKASLIGGVVIGMLVLLSWWGGLLPWSAERALVLVGVNPLEGIVKVTEGEKIIFTAKAEGSSPLRYQWMLDGRPVSQKDVWSYLPTAGENGSEARRVSLFITDRQGQRVEKHWQVTVAQANPLPHALALAPIVETFPVPSENQPPQNNTPPQITQYWPNEEALTVLAGERLAFSTAAKDMEGDTLTYAWSVNGKKVTRGVSPSRPTFNWKAQGVGVHHIQASVSDRAGLTTTQEWQVTVFAPVSQPSEGASLFDNTPPQITERIPDEGLVTIADGDSKTFSATTVDSDGDDLKYEWMVNGKKVSHEPSFFFTARGKGMRTIELAVVDQRGLKSNTHWQVQVTAPTITPQLVMFTPHEAHCSLYPHISRFFGVEVTMPGTSEPDFRYEWKIDGQPVAGEVLLEFKNQPVGEHEVEVTVTSPTGASIVHRWTVQVLADEKYRPAIYPPDLEIVDLQSTVSPDKKRVTIEGTLRNIDEERSADNVVVWVTALDARGEATARRMTLPSPQPVAPGQAANFQVQLINRVGISDFHVEAIIK